MGIRKSRNPLRWKLQEAPSPSAAAFGPLGDRFQTLALLVLRAAALALLVDSDQMVELRALALLERSVRVGEL